MIKSLLTTLLLLSVANAQAGTLVNGVWNAGACGDKPAVPTVNGKNDKTYNATVQATNAYFQAMDSYLACVVNEANADIATVTQSANKPQQDAAAVREKLLAELKAAEDKLK